MDNTQCKMARVGLGWTRAQLAEAAGVGEATVARFEAGRAVLDETIEAIKQAFMKKRVRFVEDGELAGAVYMGLRRGKS